MEVLFHEKESQRSRESAFASGKIAKAFNRVPFIADRMP
jgi:hypothetical protein